MKHAKCYIKDYPRPQFTRPSYLNLNGEWAFVYESDKISKSLKNGFESHKKIVVPFTYETKLSGINIQEPFNEVWYSKKVILTKAQLTDVVYLHFEGVDYFTTVYVNGKWVGENKGAYHRFSFDIRDALRVGENIITVQVKDGQDFYIPRGKQRWHNENFFCFYVQTTGIWKTVWLEFLNKTHLDSVKITPEINDNAVNFDLEFSSANPNAECEINITYDNHPVQRFSVTCQKSFNSIKVPLTSSGDDALFLVNYWTPSNPCLYDVEFTIKEKGKVVDKVGSYFALREFKAENEKLLLNTESVYLKLVLDQGYYAESGLTPPNEQAILDDILIAQSLGYNGARKHQKIEDERYLYYADILGFFVWCEMPSAYGFSDKMTGAVLKEWHEIVCQNYNHPSIIAWVGLNESWGVKTIYSNKNMQAFANAMYYQTKAIDGMRPVISNDGWDQTLTDILTLHNYQHDKDVFLEFYDDVVKTTTGYCKRTSKQPFAMGYKYSGQPIIISEYGGIVFEKDNVDGAFGYGNGAKDQDDYLDRFSGLYQAIRKMPQVCGLCYTQLTDVEQEVNGLVDMERKPKVPIEKINEIMSK